MKINVKIRKYNDEIKTLYFFFSFYVNFFSKIFMALKEHQLAIKLKSMRKSFFIYLFHLRIGNRYSKILEFLKRRFLRLGVI